MNKRIAVLIAALVGSLAQTAAGADAPAAAVPPPVPTPIAVPAPAAADALYARVNGKAITQRDFHGAYANYLREKYYHQQVPEDKLAEAKEEVGKMLVDRVLLLDEAKRRGLIADATRIDRTIAEYEARYASSQMWQSRRESLLPGLRQQLSEQDLLRQIDEIGHAIAVPTDAAVREFYGTRAQLFTEPEKMRLHTILLKVDPSAAKATWDAARAEAGRIVARLGSGEASFADMAALHSQDASADKGGDMGYVHVGMVPDPVQAQIDETPLRAVSKPIDVLEGVAIFRLDERIPSKLMAYDDVAGRARDLLKRELTSQTWDAFRAGLRKGAQIELAEPAQPALPPSASN